MRKKKPEKISHKAYHSIICRRRRQIFAKKVREGKLVVGKPRYRGYNCSGCGKFAKVHSAGWDYWGEEYYCHYTCGKCGERWD